MSPIRALSALRSAALATSIALLAGPALAQQMVSVSGNTLNMRDGPSTGSTVMWELQKGYPLQVTQRKGGWLQVRDFEGDTGWVARSLTGQVPHHIVKSRVANVRSGPSERHRVVGKAEYGEVLRTRAKQANWVQVERANGTSGWVAKPLLWGW